MHTWGIQGCVRLGKTNSGGDLKCNFPLRDIQNSRRLPDVKTVVGGVLVKEKWMISAQSAFQPELMDDANFLRRTQHSGRTADRKQQQQLSFFFRLVSSRITNSKRIDQKENPAARPSVTVASSKSLKKKTSSVDHASKNARRKKTTHHYYLANRRESHYAQHFFLFFFFVVVVIRTSVRAPLLLSSWSCS